MKRKTHEPREIAARLIVGVKEIHRLTPALGQSRAPVVEEELMHDAPMFEVGQPVRDTQAHDEIGRVETVRSDGTVNVRWRSGRTEWIRADEIEHAPGYKPKKRPRS